MNFTTIQNESLRDFLKTEGTNLFQSPSIDTSTPDNKSVTVDIGAQSMNAFNAVDSFLNLGNSNRLEAFGNLSEEEKEKFIQILTKLLKQGYIGYEVLEVGGAAQRYDLAMQIGEKITYNGNRQSNTYSF